MFGFGKISRKEIVGNGSISQGILRKHPYHIGQEGCGQPPPSQHGVDVAADTGEGRSFGGKCDIADRTKHGHAKKHGQPLHPKHFKAAYHAKKQSGGQRSPAEGNGTLQPTGPR